MCLCLCLCVCTCVLSIYSPEPSGRPSVTMTVKFFVSDARFSTPITTSDRPCVSTTCVE